jgi:NAD+ kinase
MGVLDMCGARNDNFDLVELDYFIMFMHFGFTTKRALEDEEGIVQKAYEFLVNAGHTVSLCNKGCKLIPGQKPALDFKKNYDLLVVFGGDGSLLRTIHFMENFDLPVLSVNMGTLGFLTEVKASAVNKALEKFLLGKYTIDERLLLRGTVMRKGKRVFSHRALNDVVIARDALARIVKLKTTVEDRLLTTYTADGLIISTPTGSTGYSLSAGGPIVYPRMDAMVLTPIAPHSFTQKPIVLPADKKLSIEMETANDRVYVTIDGQTGFHLKDGDFVKIKKSSRTVKLVQFTGSSYYKTLRSKLGWGSNNIGR